MSAVPSSPDEPGDRTALDAALRRVGDRWSLLVVHALLAGPQRFGELREAVGGIAPNVLSQRLKQLEAVGVVVARPYQQRPERFTYELTADGAGLAGVLRLLAAFGGDDAPRHVDCGGAVQARWWCPTCAHAVRDDELGSQRLV